MGVAFGRFQRAPMTLDRRQVEQEIVKSREIDELNEEIHRNELSVLKLLLLGAGESGKSTLFKQIIGIYGEGFPENTRMKYRDSVFSNIIQCMQSLCRNSGKLDSQFGNTKVQPQNEQYVDVIMDLQPTGTVVTRDLVDMWANLWSDPGIQKTFSLRSHFQLLDSAEYYFGRLDEISAAGYVPNEQDVLRTRVKTTGIIETEFKIGETRFRMLDVGGQRSERKKWIHCFEDVTAVLFVAALSEYDQVLEEDPETNRLREAIDLFNQICNNQYLSHTSMILFLNKSDLFKEKIKRVPLTVFDPECKIESDVSAATDYILPIFLDQNITKGRKIYPHVTCATDSSNVKIVFEAVKDIVLTKSLQTGGLVMP